MACCQLEENICEKYPEKTQELESYIAGLPQEDIRGKQRGYLIGCLHKAQDLFGYLPESLQLFVADKFNLQLSDVYGVVSFYSFFTTTPPGRNKVHVCTGTACFVRGADRVLAEFEERLGIKDGETREDLEFSLGGIRCLGACSLAPIVTVNGKVYSNVKPEMVKGIIEECK